MGKPKLFNEEALRREIVGVWGEYGAHAEVFDTLLRDREVLYGTLRGAVSRLPSGSDYRLEAEAILARLEPNS